MMYPPIDVLEAADKVEQWMRDNEVAALAGLARRELAKPALDKLEKSLPFKWD